MLNSVTFTKELKRELDECREMYEKTIKSFGEAPEGSLSIHRSGAAPQYYVYRNGQQKKIKKDDWALAGRLAQKSYDARVLPILERRIAALQKTLETMEETPEGIYESLSVCRRKLIRPLREPLEEAVRKWYESNPGNCNSFPMSMTYPTERGEMVRSKSEKMLADLFQRLEIPYIYEPKIAFDNGTSLCPDFLLYDKRERRSVIYEHFGMMGDEEYAGNAIRKIQKYEENGYRYGVNFLYSMESAGQPLQLQQIRRNLERYLL